MPGMAPIHGPDQRDDVEQPGDHPDDEPERQVDDGQPDRHHDADDERDDELAPEEAADGAVEPVREEEDLGPWRASGIRRLDTAPRRGAGRPAGRRR